MPRKHHHGLGNPLSVTVRYTIITSVTPSLALGLWRFSTWAPCPGPVFLFLFSPARPAALQRRTPHLPRTQSRSAQLTIDGPYAYGLLRAGVQQSLPHLEEKVDVAALHAWSLVHGLAMLVLDRRIEWDEAMVEQVVGMTFGGVD